MVLILNQKDVQEKLRVKSRERRLELGFTQEGLAARARVSVATLRKFEYTGKISLDSFIKLSLVLNVIDDLAALFDREPNTFQSIDEVLKDIETPKRQKGWRT